VTQRCIWVTGASGMLGTAVMNAVAEKAHKLLAYAFLGRPIHEPEEVRGWLMGQPAIDIIINCAGRVPSPTATPADMIRSNALGPHVLAATGLPVIHMSTDCVFNPAELPLEDFRHRIGISVDHPPMPHDVYGRTKLLGEVDAPNVVNVRGSFAGWDGGLLKWLLDQHGPIDAWEAAYWSGTSVHIMAERLVQAALDFLDGKIAAGTYHAATAKHASKADVLRAVAGALELPVTLRSVQRPSIWRVLAPSPGWELPPVSVAVADLVQRYRERVQA